MVFIDELPCYLAPSSGLKYAFEVMPRPPSLPHGGRGLAYGATAGFLAPPAGLKYADLTRVASCSTSAPVCWPEVRGHDSHCKLLDYLSPSAGSTFAGSRIPWCSLASCRLPGLALWHEVRVRGHAQRQSIRSSCMARHAELSHSRSSVSALLDARVLIIVL